MKKSLILCLMTLLFYPLFAQESKSQESTTQESQCKKSQCDKYDPDDCSTFRFNLGIMCMDDHAKYGVNSGNLMLTYTLDWAFYQSRHWDVGAGFGLLSMGDEFSVTSQDVSYNELLMPLYLFGRYYFQQPEQKLRFYLGCDGGYDFSVTREMVVQQSKNVDIVTHHQGYYNRGFFALPHIGLRNGRHNFELGYNYHYTPEDSGYEVQSVMFRYAIFM